MARQRGDEAMGSDPIDEFLENFEALDGSEAPELAPGLGQVLASETGDVRPEDDAAARSIASSMGVAAGTLLRVVGGKEAGRDKGKVFYTLIRDGVGIAIREDRLRAYVTDVLEDGDSAAAVRGALGNANIRAAVAAESETRFGSASRTWVQVAEGRAPIPGTPEAILYLDPTRPEEPLAVDALSLLSMELYGFLTADDIDKEALKELKAIAVVPGDVVARGVPESMGQPGQDVFGCQIAPGLESEHSRMEVGVNVSVGEDGQYRAERFGYLCLLEGRISSLSPLWLSRDCMKAYLVVLDDKAHPVTPEMLLQCLKDAGVAFGIDGGKVASKAAQIRQGGHERGMYLIAEGLARVEGEDAVIEIRVDLERKAGKVLDDGSIDYHDVNFMPSVRANQLVAQRRPATRGTPGKDVKSNPLEAGDGKDKPLKAGSNLRVEQKGTTELYFSTIDGALRYQKDELSAIELLVVKGDVSFNTGNLDFGGEVVVDGSILQGFSVKAGGPVTITGTVEGGATVGSRADVTIGKGIVGRKTRVVAQGSIRAQFVQEATLIAGVDIVLGNYSYHAQLHCSGQVIVNSGAGSKGGSVMGGQTWALKGVEARMIGTKVGSETLVVSGVNQEQVRKLDKTTMGMEACSEHIAQILRRFNLTQIDMAQIKNMLAASTGPRRKILMHQARQLGKLAQLYQELLAQKKALEEDLEASLDVHIKAAGTVFPGTTVRIGDFRKKIVEEVRGARFHVDDDKLVTA